MAGYIERFTHASLDPDLRFLDLVEVSLLAGIGFTVSLLIGELAFSAGGPRHAYPRFTVPSKTP